MKRLTVHSDAQRLPGRWATISALAAVLAFLAVSAGTALAENTNQMLKPPVPLPGGLGLHPVITSVSRTQDVVSVEWFGLQGPFTVLHSTAADSQRWLNLAAPTYGSKLTAPISGDTG